MTKKHDQAVQHSSEDPNWRTPPALFAALNNHFLFELDCAADEQSRLCQHWLGPGSVLGENALACDWTRTVVVQMPVFLNPPYSRRLLRSTKDPSWDIAAWARKCYGEAKAGCTIVGLFPYSVQTDWYRRWVMGHADSTDTNGRGWHPQLGWTQWVWSGFAADQVWKLRRRVSYVNATTGEPGDNAGGNSCVIVWRPNPGFVGPWQPAERYWDWED